MEVSLQTSIDVEVIEEGSTTLPARRFFSICRDLPSHQIDLSMNNEKEEIIIKSGSFEGVNLVDFLKVIFQKYQNLKMILTIY